MPKYKVVRDSYNFKVTDGEFDVAGASNARGDATIQLIQLDGLAPDCGLDLIPTIGSPFTSIDGFNNGAATTCYIDILLDSIQEEFYGTNNDCRIWTLDYSSDKNEETLWDNFRAEFQVISINNPVLWKSAQCIDPASEDEPTGATLIQGGVDGRIVRKILQGSVDLQKNVHPDKVDDFWIDYKLVMGKLNTRDLYVIGDSNSNAIIFKRGQALVGSINGGDLNGGTYTFRVTFQFKIINQNNSNGDCICRDDWNYAYTNVGKDKAGWVIPVQTTGVDECTLTTEPFTYPYSGLNGSVDNINALIFTDYSQPD